MDIEALQGALRDFAAQRDWQQFHSPKNLATALMVEAAELAEIFQWMTPDESRQAHGQPAVKQRIGEEIADVLLYLVQVADHTGTDLQYAVHDKLLQNARKYPPNWKVGLDRPASVTGPATHVLLDYENVQPTEGQLRAMVPEATNVWVFHGPHQKQIEQRFASYGDALTVVPISKTGRNALDFHLSFYMGYITSRNQQANIVVVANDTGYLPVLQHAKAMGFAVRQRGHSRASAAAAPRAPARKAAAKKTAATKTAIKKTAARNAPVAKAAAAKKAAPENAPGRKSAPKKTAAPAVKKAAKASAAAKSPAAVDAMPLPLQKILDGLRKMGAKRPVKVGSLKRALGPFLGAAASEEAVAAVFDRLIASGDVVIGASGGATYPRLG